MKIGFFDSGIGGMTVLYETLKILPNEEYLYYADTTNVPYGTKTKEEVKSYILNAAEFLVNKNIDALVIACNTGTSVAIEDLRKMYNIPIIGMEPAVKPAIVESKEKHKKVLVTATTLTLKQEKLKNLISMLEGASIVDMLSLSGLVEFAEKFDFNSSKVEEYLVEQLKPYNIQEYGTLVLGCTHFTLYKDILRKILPEDIDIIDGNRGTVENLKRILEKTTSKSESDFGVTYYNSGVEVKDKVLLDKYKDVYQKLIMA